MIVKVCVMVFQDMNSIQFKVEVTNHQQQLRPLITNRIFFQLTTRKELTKETERGANQKPGLEWCVDQTTFFGFIYGL